MSAFSRWASGPTGPKTVHFWGPAANWGLVLAALVDLNNKPPEMINSKMTGVLLLYSCVFMRFAWMVKPRNYLLFACHIANSSAQGVLLTRKLKYDMDHPEGPTAAAAEPIADASGAPAAVAAAAAVADVAPAKLQ